MPKKNPHAVALGKKGGRSRSPAKLAAIAKNAQRGGRRPKFAAGERVHVKLGAPQAYRGQLGTIVGTAGRARYDVAFENGVTVPMYSWWLETEA